MESKYLMKSQYKHLLFLLVAIIGITYFTWVTFNAGKRLEKTTDWVDHTNLVINSLNTLSITTTEIQSDFNGWLVIDKAIFKAEVIKKSKLLNAQLEITRSLTADNFIQQQNMFRLQAQAAKLLNWQDVFIQSDYATATNPINPGVKSKQLVDAVKLAIRRMSIVENNLLKERILDNKDMIDNRLSITLIGGFSYMVFAFFIVFQLKRNAAKRKTNELSILQSEIKYRRLIEDAGVVMFTTNLKGDFTFVNHKIESLTGYKDNEIINTNFSHLVVPTYLPLLADHYKNQFSQRAAHASLEFQIITKCGEEKWIEQDSVLIYDNKKIIGFQCIVRDIHSRKKTEAALHKIELERLEYEYRLQSILDYTPLMIFIKDLKGKYLLVNKSFKETFSNGQPLIGKTDYDFVSKENADRSRDADEKVMQTLQPLEVEETINGHGKSQNLMVVKFPLLDQSGKIFAISGIANDITERVLYHEHLVETRKNAELAEKLQSEFLANMSHEIRTPMNGIVGMTNLLLQTPINPEQERFLLIVKQSSDNLLFLINDILDLSKIKAGKMTIESIEFNIANVMETVIAPFRIKMKEKGVELISEIHTDIPQILIGDPYRLSQIISNIFSNAIKFTQKGYIKFTVSLSSCDGNCTVHFSVEDSGIGIAENKIQYIFESFAQANLDTSRKYGGTGLGLAITKQLIQLQEGEIDVTSVVDKGTTFRFSLPYKQVQAKITLEVSENQVIDKTALNGKRILIAEDNEINQMVISFTLKQAGISTTIVNNGREAVELLESGGDPGFDLIIMDLQMPVMDGFLASAYIRKELQLTLPIIAMTASVLQDERIRCFEAGMNDYMSKPFKPADLFFTVSKFLKDTTSKVPSENSDLITELPVTPYNFENLYKMMPKVQASEILGLFVDNTPALLNKIQTAVLLETWTEVSTHARILKSSIELLQLEEMMANITDLERMARMKIQLDSMPSIVNRLIEYFNTIKPMLEAEKNQMANV